MSLEQKLFRCAEDDPNRCQSNVKTGQCPFLAIEGSQYCRMHSGSVAKLQEKQANIYRLERFQARINQLAEHPKVKSLREEIGILRMLLESVLAKCNDADDLVMYSNKIMEMVGRVEKLVVSCHRIEQSSGELLDKSAVVNFSVQVVQIIADYVGDVSVIEKISDAIYQRLNNESTLRVNDQANQRIAEKTEY
jgi:hypothetical protein